MKKKLILLGCLVIKTILYSQNFYLDGNYVFQQESVLDEMIIKQDPIILEYKKSFLSKPDDELSFKISHISGIAFLELSRNMPIEVAEDRIWKNEKEQIKTSNKILFLAGKNNSYNIIFAFTEGFSFDYQPLTRTRFDECGSSYKDCSSFLTEKTKSYTVQNLSKLVVDTPWVEGVEGDGIGEGFTIEGESFKTPLGPYLFIINGYISYEKPYLYQQNNRVKKIKVTGLKSGKSKILDVLDTPHPQTVNISFITQSEDIRIEIEDIYKGTKYDDTCLHYCITYDSEVIPYENSIGE